MTELTALERAEMMRAPLKDQSYQTKTRLGSSVADYLAFKRMSGAAEATLSQYERDLARLCVRYEHKELGDVTSEDLLHAIGAFTVKQQRRVRAVYADFFKWAFLWGKVEENPTLRLPVIRNPERPHIETFTKAEQSALCSLPAVDGVLMLMLFETGIRKGEARAMRLKDWLPYENCEARVLLGKGRKSRTVPVPPKVIHALADLELKERLKPESYLWYGVRTNQSSRTIVRDHPVPEGTFFRWWQRCLLEEAGVEYRPKNYKTGEGGVHNTHTTRHTYATNYLRDGGSIHILSDNLGHSSVAITYATYAHLVTADRRADLDRVLSQREKR